MTTRYSPPRHSPPRHSPPRQHQQPSKPPVSNKGMGWGWVTKWDYGYVTNPVAGPPPPPKTCTAPKPKQHVSEDDWWNDILDDNENSISERFRGASKSYRTFDTIDRRMDVFAPARHTGQIYRGSIQNPELNSPKDRAFGSGSDFNPGDEISFRSAPRGQTLIVTKEQADAFNLVEGSTMQMANWMDMFNKIRVKNPHPNAPGWEDYACREISGGSTVCGPNAVCAVEDPDTANCACREGFVNVPTASRKYNCQAVVDGAMTPWTTWGPIENCQTEANGQLCDRTRTRQCTPAINGGTEGCSADPSDSETEAVYHGGWSEWIYSSNPGSCSVASACTRHKECTNPSPTPGIGQVCQGTMEFESVYDGDFSPWSDGVQSDCTPLGAGTVCDFTRTRTCTNPSPTNGGDDCVGELTDVSEVTNGGWSYWVDSATPGVLKTRICNNPAPSGDGGLPCDGDAVVYGTDVVCDQTTSKTVTIEDGKSYTFKTQKGKRYKGNTKCTVDYKMGDTCAKMSFVCTKFNTNNKDKKTCKKGDKVTVTANGISKAYCKTKKPKVTSTGDITVAFTSDKKKSSSGAVCKIKCILKPGCELRVIVRNAITNGLVTAKGTFRLGTDAVAVDVASVSGVVSHSVFANGFYTIEIEADGFISDSAVIIVQVDEFDDCEFPSSLSLSPTLPAGQTRIIMNWFTASPPILDLHVMAIKKSDGSMCRTTWNCMSCCASVVQDVDQTSGGLNGGETTTLLDNVVNSQYIYMVATEDYDDLDNGGADFLASGVMITVTDGMETVKKGMIAESVSAGTEFIVFGCVDVQSDGTAFHWYPAVDGTFINGGSSDPAVWSLSLCGL